MGGDGDMKIFKLIVKHGGDVAAVYKDGKNNYVSVYNAWLCSKSIYTMSEELDNWKGLDNCMYIVVSYMKFL